MAAGPARWTTSPAAGFRAGDPPALPDTVVEELVTDPRAHGARDGWQRRTRPVGMRPRHRWYRSANSSPGMLNSRIAYVVLHGDLTGNVSSAVLRDFI